MVRKSKKAVVRPVVSLRVRPAMYEDLVREADKRRIKLSEEVERRLIRYEEKMEDVDWVAKEIEQRQLDVLTDDQIDKIAERIVKMLKPK
jgi:guanylate kinase